MNPIKSFSQFLSKSGIFCSVRAKFPNGVKALFLIGILFLLGNPAYGEVITLRIKVLMLPRCHMCHDPFIPRDHLVLVPEDDLIRMERVGEFRIYTENTFRSPLQDVELLVESPAFDIEVKPRILKRLIPGERTFFLVKLKLKGGYKLGDYPLRIRVKAREAVLRPSIEKIGVVVSEEVPQLPIKPLPKAITPEVVPEVKPREEIPQLPVESVEEVITPEIEPEVKPQEEVIPLEKVPVPEDIVEPPVEEAGKIVVRVEEIPFWRRPYFYLVLLGILLGLILVRKLKRK